MVTDQNANIIARHDYAPFGQEIPGGVGPRTSLWGASDNVNQKFTGQERDGETNLDYFQARYFSSGLGRFTSPDPHNAGAAVRNPQSWNAYAYVLGNPLNSVDPTGLDCYSRSGPQAHDSGSCSGNYGPPEYGGVSIDGGAAFSAGLFGSGSNAGGGESAVGCPANGCSGFINGQPFSAYADASGSLYAVITSAFLSLNCTGESNGGEPENYQCAWGKQSTWFVQNGTETAYFGGVQQLFNANRQTWASTATDGNVLAAATAVVAAAPIALDVASVGMYGGSQGLLAGETPVLGGLSFTGQYAGAAGYTTFSVPSSIYSWSLNAAWLQSQILTGQSFLLGAGAFGTAAEVGYLLGKGFSAVGPFLVPPLP
jgi:RHS repeat-associated protein